MSNSRIDLIRRLFAPKVYNPKSMFYLAYKSARLNGVSFSKLPKKIRKMQHDMDTQIIACGEDIDHTLAIEELEKWDWTQQKRLPFQLFLAAMHLKEIPDWLDETMLIESVYYFKELINYRDPYDTDEFNTWNMNGKPFKTIWKICKFCYTNCEDPDEYRFMFNRTVFAEDAEEIVQRFQDENSWCEICHTCPLFNISVIYENSLNNKRKCLSSSDDEDIISDSFYVKHPKAEN